MRTNPFPSPRGPRAIVAARDTGRWLPLTAPLAGILAVLALQPTVARADDPAAPAAPAAGGVCHTVGEVAPTFFTGVDVASFDFSGDDAAKMAAAIQGLSGDSGGPIAASLHLVVVPDTAVFDAFFFGADGCNTRLYTGLDYTDVQWLFQATAIAPPPNLQYYAAPSLHV